MNNATHILFILNSLQFGGAEKHVVSLIQNIDIKRFRVSLVYLKDKNAHLLSQVKRSVCPRIICAGVGHRLDVSAARRIAKIIEQDPVDAIMAVDQYPMVYAYVAKRIARSNAKLIVALHFIEPQGIYERIKMGFYRLLFPRFDLAIFVSNVQKHYWVCRKKYQFKRAITIYNGIEASAYSCNQEQGKPQLIRQRYGFTNKDYVVGVCGILRPEKQHVFIVQAAHAARTSGLNIKFLFIGDGPERKKVEEVIHQLDMCQHIKITGYQTEVSLFLSACDCSLVASRSEAFSLSILESMALCLPVVASKVGGVVEQVEHGVTGLLFDPADSHALIQSLKLLSDPQLRMTMGKAGRERVKACFSFSDMIAQYQDAFVQITRH